MKSVFTLAVASAILSVGYAIAQDATVTIEPAHRTIIHQYVVKERVRPVRLKETVNVGAVIPTDVALQPVPEAWTTEVPEVAKYQYFDWDGKVVFVEPQTRRVVQIVD